MMIIDLLTSMAGVAVILLIWFRTEAFVEYTKWLRLTFLSWSPLYEAQKHEDLTLTYIAFLRKNFDGFFVQLITCPICVAFWLSVFFNLFFCTTTLCVIPLVMVGSLIMYGLVSLLLE